MLRYAALIAVLFVACASAGKLNFLDCPEADKSLGYIFSVNCVNFTEGADILLKKGGSYHFEIEFETAQATATLKPKIVGIIAGVNVPWNGAGTDACANLVGNTCPLKEVSVYRYAAAIEVLKEYPAVGLTFQWALVGADGKNQICFRMPAKIVA